MISKKKKALVIYYTQSGQLKQIIDHTCQPLEEDFDLVYEELKPVREYPFPWKGMSFYQAFPESVQEIPCEMQPYSFDPDEDFDLVILAYQTWYLSPSIPISSFLQSEAARVLKGKPVITLLGCRNMWIMAHERVKKRIAMQGGKHVGNIVLVDKHHNLVSVITIVRWMLKGDRHGNGLYAKIFPKAGVDENDIRESSKFGEVIKQCFDNGRLDEMQDLLLEKGAVQIKPVLLTIESRGYMMFKPWSKFILKKGAAWDPAREGRLKMFRAYLFTVIYLVSPIGSIVVWLIHKIGYRKTQKMVNYYSHNELKQVK